MVAINQTCTEWDTTPGNKIGLIEAGGKEKTGCRPSVQIDKHVTKARIFIILIYKNYALPRGLTKVNYACLRT